MLPRLTPELPKTTSAVRSSPPMRARARTRRRSISAGENLSHTAELLREPIGHKWPVLVRNVVADVVALLVEDQVAIPGRVRDPLRLLPRDDAVELARDHERRPVELGDHGSEVELERRGAGRVVAAEADSAGADGSLPRERVERSRDGSLVVGTDVRREAALALARAVEGECGEPAGEEDLFPVEELLLCRVEARQEKDERAR